MSNLVVGDIYKEIINRVIASCQVDFEESGVPRETLMEMDQNWKARLSSFNPAEFEWDPTRHATNQPTTSTAATVPKIEEGAGNSATSYQAPANGVSIKTEPGYEGYTSASDRAKDILRQQYGQQASASISQMQQPGGFAMPGQPRPAQGFQLPGQHNQQRPPQPQQFPPQAQQPSLSNAQTDGADDDAPCFDPAAFERIGSTSGRLAADVLIRSQIEAMATQMDSGLPVPLSEHPSSRKGKQRADLYPKSHSSRSVVPQLDGDDDDDDDTKDDLEKDEDAINSDLDDSEDELDQVDDEDEETTHISEAILCTYDKVQRVKNKWKCTLKDGILTTKGKDYVFHKAQGEFEW